MQKIQGKQIQNETIEQRSMIIETDLIINNNSVTNKQYVINRVNQSLSGIYQSRLNLNMTASGATSGELACEKGIIEFPLSSVMVKLNGILMDVGSDKDFYFSPDGGNTKRENGYAEKGDKLYWNSTDYNLDDEDEIDIIYLVGYDYIDGYSGDTVQLNPIYNSIVVKFNGDVNETMSVIINGDTIIVGNVGGNFIWDIGGSNEYTFTEVGDSILVNIGGEDYTIWFDGFGSLIFSVRKGDWVVETIDAVNVKYGFLYNVYVVDDERGIVNIDNIGDWDIPSWDRNDDYDLLEVGEFLAYPFMTTGTTYWVEDYGLNTYGFNAKGSGLRTQTGTFSLPKTIARYHKKELTEIFGFDYRFNNSIQDARVAVREGNSIRLCRNLISGESSLSNGTVIEKCYTGNDGKVYNGVKIGNRVWLNENLCETKWYNGTWIKGYDNGVYTPNNWSLLSESALCALDDNESNVLQ